MNKRVLFVATVDRGHILKFHLPYLKYFKEKGFEVHVACAGDEEIQYCDKKYKLDFMQSPYKVSNIKVYMELKKIIDKNGYSLIHCHTPVGGVVGRLAAKDARKNGTKVLYTAHGFHFYKGAPIINWILFYPVEKWLSRYTDCLITINKEDYEMTQKHGFKAISLKLVGGVGIDLDKFTPQTSEEKSQLRKDYGYEEDDFILIYAADLNANKHQDLLINVVNILKNKIPNIKLLLAGEGTHLESYIQLTAKLKLEENVKFIGYRKDIPELLKLSDIAVSSSRREGLPVNIMEAMAIGLPLAVTGCRGNRDLVINGENGFLVDAGDVEGLVDVVNRLYQSDELRQEFRETNLEFAKQYCLEKIVDDMEQIYLSCLEVH